MTIFYGKSGLNILKVATSYPRLESDWQGVFIRNIANHLSSQVDVNLTLWCPNGPRAEAVGYACSSSDSAFLSELADSGGIAHLLRKNPVIGVYKAAQLLTRLRRLYVRQKPETDIFHINWLQNALPLTGMGVRAVITVLGTDFKLLKIPGMVTLIRKVLSSNRCILAPNAHWMMNELERLFGDLAQVRQVNFGIDKKWFEVSHEAPGGVNRWLCILRVTDQKIGPLFDWGEKIFVEDQQLHLFGPNQQGLDVPKWVHYHGPASPSELIEQWYPKCVGFVTLSQHSEGKPQVLLETLAAGVPIIASSIPAHEETIEDNVTGILVSSESEFRNAVDRLQDPVFNLQASSECRASSLREFGTWDDCIQRYLKLYEVLI